ncbi:MAG TPA: amidase [Burkholderiaceae bacterium]
MLTATGAALVMATGETSSEQLVEACLARIREREPAVQAWQFLDEAHALTQARERDRERFGRRAIGPLHGLPVGVKDIIDTADMPTENGSVLHAGRRPDKDAAVVASLRVAGAVILGKTVSTEFAAYAAGKTRNPHDPTRTPGGSSSGSAAAVAAGMVPLAIGTQTNASVVRPAAYCGVHGFKPSHGRISRDGVLTLSPTLDTVGMFARSLDDIALLARVLADVEPVAAGPRTPPRLAFVKTAAWERADLPTRAALAALSAALGTDCEEVDLPEAHAEAWDCHRTIMEAEMAVHLEQEWAHGRDGLSASLREQLGRGRDVPASAYQRALKRRTQLADSVAELFTRFDAILTPATTGTAPPLDTTGDPAFGTLWTLCGLPAISLPLRHGPDGLPLGVQLVGAHSGDARLLQHARWLEHRLRAP